MQRESKLVDHMRFIRMLDACDTWFDVAVESYLYIKRTAFSIDPQLTEELFIAEYIDDHPGESDSNPNREMLLEFMSEAADRIVDFEHDKVLFSESLQLVQQRLGNLDLVPFGCDPLNEATIAWFLILAIDTAYEEVEPKRRRSTSGPLNTHSDDCGVGVYLRCPHARLEDILQGAGLSRIPEYAFNNQLSMLTFLEKGDMLRLPHIVRLPYEFTGHECTQDIGALEGQSKDNEDVDSAGLRLKIGVCPFTSRNITGFDDDSLIRFKVIRGSAFTTVYDPSVDEYYDRVVQPALEVALAKGCNVVIFPEIVFAPSFHRRLRDFLKAYTDVGELFFVVAGSTWDEQERANIAHLYDRRGRLIGTYHKATPFLYPTSQGDLLEGIKRPDESATLVDIVGLGRILPTICKDAVSEDSIAFKLARELKPQIVCIPAFSTSVDRGFDLPMKRLVERHLAVSCMSNYCAVRPAKNDLGYVMCPGCEKATRPKKKAISYPESFKKDNCESTCLGREKGSCLQVVEIDYPIELDGRTYPLVNVQSIPLVDD